MTSQDPPYDSGANFFRVANFPEKADMSGWSYEKLRLYIQRGVHLLRRAIKEREKFNKIGLIIGFSRRDVREMMQYLKSENIMVNLTDAGVTQSEGASRDCDTNSFSVAHVPWQDEMKRWDCEQLTSYIENILKLLTSATATLKQMNKNKMSGASISQVDQSNTTQAEGMKQNASHYFLNRFQDCKKTMPNFLTSRESSNIKRNADKDCSEQVRTRKRHKKHSLCTERSQDVPCTSGLEVRNCSKSTSNFSLHEVSRTDKEIGEKMLIETVNDSRLCVCVEKQCSERSQDSPCVSGLEVRNCSESTSNVSLHEASRTDKEIGGKILLEAEKRHKKHCSERSQDSPCDSGIEVHNCSESTSNFSLHEASRTDKEIDGKILIEAGKAGTRNLLCAEKNQDGPCTSGHQARGCDESTSNSPLLEASVMEKELDKECVMETESSKKHTRNLMCSIESQDVPSISGHEVSHCNESTSNFPAHEASVMEKEHSEESPMEKETGSDNLHDAEKQGKTGQASEEVGSCHSVQVISTPAVQTGSETVTEINPGIIAANTLLESMGCDSAEAIVILKVIKSNSELKLNPILKQEKNSEPYHEDDSHQNELEVQDSEIMWALFCVKHQLPYNTFNTIGFQSMFPDSNLAHLTINHNPERLAYIVSYGLELYFRKELLHILEKNEHCVLVFKELLYDPTAGYKQIDIYIRFWNVNNNDVEMRYLNSVFIELDEESEDVTECIWSYLEDLQNCRIIQLCLDGSPVSLQYLSYLQNKLKKHFACNVVDINNSLHSIYEAFESGAQSSEWNLGDLLRSLYLIFRDSPERCAEYIKITQNAALPLPFHGQKLLLNIKTAERAFEIWIYIKKYVCVICTEYPSLLMSNWFATLKEACDDVLMPVKLKFFISIGKRIESIINLFRSEKPMLPFFYRELKALENRCKNYFDVPKCGYSSVRTVDKLVDFELNDNSSALLKDGHLDFSANKIFKELSHNHVTTMQEVVMKASAQEFVLKLNEKFLKDPYLNNPLFECLSCLDPLYIVSNTEDCNNKFAHILSLFMEKNHLYESMCEDLQGQFSVFLDNAVLYHKKDFKNFDPFDDKFRLDTFLHHYLSDKKFEKLWHFIKALLLLFNGQVDSTRCVAVDEDDNISEIKVDYTARRFISDHLKGHDTNIVVTDEMRQVVNDAFRNYMNLCRSTEESPS